MCGIFGYATTSPRRADAIDLDAAEQALRHRGPDGSGRFVAATDNTAVGLVHTRLSILDLSDAAAQPMTDQDARYTLVFNGEIYNFRQVRDELAQAGAVVRSSGDTEVLLAGWRLWGPAVLDRLNGMFAFAVWDSVDHSLFLARDRLGIKPLYVAETHDGVAFASEVRALIAAGCTDRRIDPAGLESMLTWGACAGETSLVKGVRSMSPGSWMRWQGGQVTTGQWWTAPLPSKSGSDSPTSSEVGEALQQAVSRRLVSDVPLGVFLSGGTDSAAIVSLAARSQAQPLHTFTVSFDERAYDESTHARTVADRFGCAHTEVVLAQDDLPPLLEQACAAYDQPMFDGVNTWLVSRAAREAGLKVCLSGLGGDEVFAGYPHFSRFGQLVRWTRRAQLARLPISKALSGLPPFRLPSRISKTAELGTAGGEPADVYQALRCFFTRAETQHFVGHVPSPSGPTISSLDVATDPVNAYGCLELGGYLHDTTLRATDVMSMAHGLEVRVPLIDHTIVETGARIPGAQKLAGRLNKSVLVNAVGDLPMSAIDRPKMGFVLPYATWFKGPLRGFVEDRLFDHGGALGMGLVKQSTVEALWQGFLRGESVVSHARVWALVVLSDWCRRQGLTA